MSLFKRIWSPRELDRFVNFVATKWIFVRSIQMFSHPIVHRAGGFFPGQTSRPAADDPPACWNGALRSRNGPRRTHHTSSSAPQKNFMRSAVSPAAAHPWLLRASCLYVTELLRMEREFMNHSAPPDTRPPLFA